MKTCPVMWLCSSLFRTTMSLPSSIRQLNTANLGTPTQEEAEQLDFAGVSTSTILPSHAEGVNLQGPPNTAHYVTHGVLSKNSTYIYTATEGPLLYPEARIVYWAPPEDGWMQTTVAQANASLLARSHRAR